MNYCFFWRGVSVKITVITLLVAMICCIAPVYAVSIDIGHVGTINNWAFNPASDNTNTSISLTVTTSDDTSTWHVYVKDANNNLKPPSWSGRMVEFDGTNYVTPSPKILGNNVSISVSDSPGIYSGTTTTLGPVDTTLVTGTAPVVSGVTIPLTIHQTTTYSDPHLTTSDHSYRVIVTYTATTN